VFDTDQQKSWEAGAKDFLPKPVQADDPFQKLKNIWELNGFMS
jgi:hypothetical protein